MTKWKKMTDKEKISEIAFDRRIRNERWLTELDIAIRDLLAKNYFSVVAQSSGPYALEMKVVDNRINISAKSGEFCERFTIPVSSFKSLVKDYFILFDSYQDALNMGHHTKLEAIDMGRRGLHNEAAETLIEVLEGKVNMDFDTARRLFTIIMVLHLK
jgi:uncharacterized protein (UPF0262 family)